jgi:hypothetical protein
MKALKSLTLFLFTSMVPCVSLYLLLDGLVFKVALGLYIIFWGLLYTYLDKILLMFINAREVIDTDEQLLFQNVKNVSYKTYEKRPCVYLYSGQKLNCFVFESRNEWAIVIERRLLDKLDNSQLESLVSFLYEYKKNNSAWYQTKAMGICALIYSNVYWILGNLLFLDPSSKLFKTLSVFTLAMLRPLTGPIESFAKNNKEISVDENLKSIFYQIDKSNLTFNEYILGHLMTNIQLRSLLLNYLESFPVMENFGFSKNETK